jgi:uracil-DNA glycosylase
VRFWASARARAGELLEKRESSIQPGIDFALTEVVHCKSLSERGVQEAQKFCSALYLRKILDISVAKVLVVYGVIAREEVCGCLHLWDEVISERKLLGPVTIAEIPRMLIFLPHPSSWMRKTLKANLEGTELSLLRKHLMEPSKCGIS